MSILKGVDTFTGASFSWANRLGRVLWMVVYLLLFRPSPRPLHVWRSWLLRCFGASLGRGCHVYPSARIWAPWNLRMHDFSGLGDGAFCYCIAPVEIGARSVISQGAVLCTGTHDYSDSSFQLQARPIVIGSHAWVAAEAFVCPGVTIGDGAVIGARSVVTKDMPAWTVCMGHPCRPVKPRSLSQA